MFGAIDKRNGVGLIAGQFRPDAFADGNGCFRNVTTVPLDDFEFGQRNSRNPYKGVEN